MANVDLEHLPLRDFLEVVNKKNGCGIPEAELDQCAQILHENGYSLASDVKSLSSDWFMVLGMPPPMITAIQSEFRALDAGGDSEAASVGSIADLQRIGGIADGDRQEVLMLRARVVRLFPAESSARNDYLLLGLLNLLRERGQAAANAPDGVIVEHLNRALQCSRLWKNIIRLSRENASSPAGPDGCGICHQSISGPKQRLECGHKFCPSCVNKHINLLVSQKKAVGLACPVADCTRELSNFMIQSLLMPAEYEVYLKSTLEAFVDASDSTFLCPNGCGTTIMVSMDPRVAANKPITETDESGKLLSPEAYRHFTEYRIRCHSCKNVDFCADCKHMPYHKGFTCASWATYQTSRHCRFCKDPLDNDNTVKNPKFDTLRDVCTDETCETAMNGICVKRLGCGCPCNGVRDEEVCLPCLTHELNMTAEDTCPICTGEFNEEPCIQLTSCKHIMHIDCAVKALEQGPSGARVTFGFMNCLQDKVPMEHPALDEVMAPLRAKKVSIQQKALARLSYEGRQKDDRVAKPGGDFYGKTLEYAMYLYMFYKCNKCNNPYFAGGYQCAPSDNEWNPEELICAGCQPKTLNQRDCPTHGTDWIAFKCRFCCSFATFYCWGNCHFCDNCHKPAIWKTLANFKTGANKKEVWQYPQCPGLKPQVEKIRRNARLTKDQKTAAFQKIYSDPQKCPLKIRHPANGVEFGMGCSMCEDKETEEKNVEAAGKAMGELQGEFTYRKDFDERGVLYWMGRTYGTKKTWKNPAVAGFVKISNSALEKDSEDASTIVGRKTVRCVTECQPNSWFIIDLVNRTVAPTHYSLKHYSSWAGEALRNWRLSGSTDGKQWDVLSDHKADESLIGIGSTHTWELPGSAQGRYRCFCIMQTGANSSGHFFLSLSGFELYGKVYSLPS